MAAQSSIAPAHPPTATDSAPLLPSPEEMRWRPPNGGDPAAVDLSSSVSWLRLRSSMTPSSSTSLQRWRSISCRCMFNQSTLYGQALKSRKKVATALQQVIRRMDEDHAADLEDEGKREEDMVDELLEAGLEAEGHSCLYGQQ